MSMLADHEDELRGDDRRLEKLEAHAVQTSARLDHIERTQVSHGSKLDQIMSAVTRAEGRPQFDFSRTVSMVRDLFAIGAVLASVSIWLVLTLTAANDRATALELVHSRELTAANDRATALELVHSRELNSLHLAALRERLDRVSNAFNWKPSIETRP